jgi:hypothetical protein
LLGRGRLWRGSNSISGRLIKERTRWWGRAVDRGAILCRMRGVLDLILLEKKLVGVFYQPRRLAVRPVGDSGGASLVQQPILMFQGPDTQLLGCFVADPGPF